MEPANRSPAATPPRAREAIRWGMGRGGGAPLVLAILLGCGEPPLEPAPPERFVILPGMPRAEPGPRWVDAAEAGEGEMRPSRPRVCESFVLPQDAGAIDLLLVVDIGRSMEARRAEIADQLQGLLDAVFTERRPSFRVGVLSTAPPAAGEVLGHLVPLQGSLTPFVTCTPDADGEPCSNGNWENARTAILDAVDEVVTRRSSLGLLALAQAVEGNFGDQPPFVRAGADLHVVIVSDADDLSCTSRIAAPTACRSFEDCACAEDTEEGKVEEFIRHLRGIKGFGFEDRVRVSAWVATTADLLPMPDGSGPFAGCKLEAEPSTCATPSTAGAPCALYAPRYRAVAEATGGLVYDLCRDPDGLAKIGAFVAGVSPEFSLRRNPLPSTVETVLLSFADKSCNHQDSCLEEGLDCIRGRCGQVVPEGGADGWQYVSCSSGIPRNMVRFESSDRLRNRKIEICYDVDVGADPLPCP